MRCIQLTPDLRCAIFGSPERPKVCGSLRVSVEMCGSLQQEALDYLDELERVTSPVTSASA